MNTSIKVFNTIVTKVRFLIKQLHLNLRKNTGRPLSIAPEEVISLALFWKQQGIKTKKSVYDIFDLSCSYKTLVVLFKKFTKEAAIILAIVMKENQKQAHIVKHTDSTDIPVCLNKNAKSHRTMKGVASFGHSGKGFYYGLKMNITTDLTGKLLALHFASANGNDREAFKKMNKDIFGIFVADSGYTSQDLEREFFIKYKRILFAKPRANMKKLATKLNNQLYDTRKLIEQHFRNLKEFYLFVTSLPRSLDGYLGNYIYSLLAYVLA